MSVKEKRGIRPKGIVPCLLLGLAILFFLIMLVFPLGEVIYRSLKEGFEVYGAAITAKNTLSALKVTLIATGIAVIVNTFFGLCASWCLTKFDFKGKNILSTLIDIPFSISPVIAGLAYLMVFGRMGWATPFIEKINDFLGTDIAFVFSVPGVVLATIFVTFRLCRRRERRKKKLLLCWEQRELRFFVK